MRPIPATQHRELVAIFEGALTSKVSADAIAIAMWEASENHIRRTRGRLFLASFLFKRVDEACLQIAINPQRTKSK